MAHAGRVMYLQPVFVVDVTVKKMVFERSLRLIGWMLCAWGVPTLCGCASLVEPRRDSHAEQAGVNRRMQLLDSIDPSWYQDTVTSQPATTDNPLTKPYHLNVDSIVRILFEQGPLIVASREAMFAAQHGLAEFRADLSRFEPFLQASGTANDFPERRNAEGMNAEVSGGLEKETFEGLLVRVEAGYSGSRVTFGEVATDQKSVEEGSGTLIRARVEVPFVGSRKYQSRIINAAYQESTARKAMLNYLTSFRSYADSALLNYRQALYYLYYIRLAEAQIERFNNLLEDSRLRSEDRRTVLAAAAHANISLDSYRRTYRGLVLNLLQLLGIEPTEAFVLQEESFRETSDYYERSRVPDGRRQMLTDAYENNPKFRVLTDAMADAELQRAQAILGQFDITAYLQGTQFPYGSATFDDRVGGWQMSLGLSVRLNEQRVLSATRNKAEAQIREYLAEIEYERDRVLRQISEQTVELCEYFELRPSILEHIANSQAEFAVRLETYLTQGPPDRTIDDVLTSIDALYVAESRIADNLYGAWVCENTLMTATGEVYRMVGLKVVGKDESADKVATTR
ncbi:MAG: TolC family protein [Phycisphaerales bacterium]|nr:TolC family protein [Phycisphaerales bacterium]